MKRKQTSRSAFCIKQVETGLLDGWYFFDRKDLGGLLLFWQELFPEYTHAIVGTNEAPPRITDSMALNQSQAYRDRL